MNKNYNILIIAQTNIISGAETVLAEYIQYNNNMDVFLYTNKKDEVYNFFNSTKGIKKLFSSRFMKSYLIKKKPLTLPIYFLSLIINAINTIRIAKENEIRIIYGNNSTDVGTLCLVRLFSGRKFKLVSHCHDMLTEKTIPGIYLKLFSSFLDLVIVPSKATKKFIERLGVNSSKIEVVHNGIKISEKPDCVSNEIKEFRFQSEKKYIGYVGTICQRKRPDIFIEVISRLKNIRNDVEAVIIGKTTEVEVGKEIRKKIEDNKLPISIVDEIPREVLMSIYGKLDILLLTSDRDPLPTVILEAMGNGCVVFSRDVDGAREMVKDDFNGFLFNYRYDIDEIVSKINLILDNPDDMNRIQENAVSTVKEEFSIEKKVTTINTLMEILLN